LRANTAVPFSLFLLTDAADEGSHRNLEANQDVQQILSSTDLGGAACFNLLAEHTDTDVFVLLENGTLFGPGWLEYLLAALEAGPNHGLAGPSTNHCWNAQAVFPKRLGDPASIAVAATEAARRFGSQTRTLEPLYSLADFCYAVRREVVESIGLADESYGLGPCWEMDYNIRAARAGWRGFWACGAYVYRSPSSTRRQETEDRLFWTSKKIYQDKFCGARLRGQKHDYRAHCRGDACPNFAAIEFMAVGQAPAPGAPLQIPLETAAADAPLVSCIMPTFNRRGFVGDAIKNFQTQDYPNLELLIVDDGTDSIEDLVPSDPRIRYVRLQEKKILGDKRNLACAEARGEFICHWDDDDWYPANRVSRQMAMFQSGSIQVCGTSRLYYFDPLANRAWLYCYSAGAGRWVAGNTLAYRRTFWERHPFAHLQVGEDSRFIWADKTAGIADLKDPALCVARVHSTNTSPKAASGSCWQPIATAEIQRLLNSNLEPFQHVTSTEPCPLISCIMPTANRANFVRLALRCFDQQDYPRRELIIVDDGQEDLSELVGKVPEAQYLRLSSPQSIGAKRNLACQKARGDIIAHWDDDDWYAPERLSRQIEPLLKNEADMSGLEGTYVLELSAGKFWNVSPELHQRMFVGNVHGGTLLFRKSIFDQGLRYPSVNLAEDAAFIRAATRSGKRLAQVSNPGLFVYVRHGANAWRFAPGRFLDATGWRARECPTAFLPWLSQYQDCLNPASRP
jgi:glycosyltransferase involved in cell wall biosynthesis